MRFQFFRYCDFHASSCFLIYFLLLFLPAFPARKITAPISVTATDDSKATWENFAKFLDVGKGSHVNGMSELKKYFHRFGYLSRPPEMANFTDIFDCSFEAAVTAYQKNLGLPVTGKLDSYTLNQITSPRCGVSDSSAVNRSLHNVKRFAYFYGHPRWEKKPIITLTYAFSDDHLTDYLSSDEIKAVFRRAFSRWAAVIPVTFTEAEDYEASDVTIGFYHGDHGDGEPFDGELGVLAHAFSPENGRLHLDAAETWAVDFESQKSKVAVDLESVATHEIGHILGLAHSSVKEAIMYPSLSPRTKKMDLRIDDVEGVQALYGSNPNFKFSSLLESDISSNQAVGFRSSLCWCPIFMGIISFISWL